MRTQAALVYRSLTARPRRPTAASLAAPLVLHRALPSTLPDHPRLRKQRRGPLVMLALLAMFWAQQSHVGDHAKLESKLHFTTPVLTDSHTRHVTSAQHSQLKVLSATAHICDCC